MKKLYLLTLFLLSFTASFANITTYRLDHKGWRWRNDDGAEATATWKADQEKPVTVTARQLVIRLRVETINRSTANGCSNGDICPSYNVAVRLHDSLQYSTDTLDANGWQTIGLDNSLPFVLAGSDQYVVQDDATTAQLAGSSDPFSAGAVMVTDSTLNNTLGAGGRTEHEWVLRTTATLAPNTKYFFRQYFVYSPLLNRNNVTYHYPWLETSKTLAIQLTGFAVTSEGKRIKLEWSQTTPADRTNIQRSTDLQSWQTIATIKYNSAHNIEYDNSPPPAAVLYYRLQQFEKDGSYSLSAIKSVKGLTGKTAISVFPNPATDAIHFIIQNAAAKNITAVLTDISGKVILTQTLKNIQPGNINKLNLHQKLSAGVYILKLAGEDFAQSTKVIVQ